ncbi:MAG: aminomethyl-transferring glycine dehydrogenase subunit GcvPA [Elusimicrobiota bacterium]
MSFIPHLKKDIDEICKELGLSDIEGLFNSIPGEVRLSGKLNLPAPLPEKELLSEIETILNMNNTDGVISFLGAGIYDHFIPSAVGALSNRSEFVTAYTPYQAEMSQGLLQIMYEYQTFITRLTGMEVSNASLYDGASATFEAVKTAAHITGRKKVIMSSLAHPEYIDVVNTGFKYSDIKIKFADNINGLTSQLSLDAELQDAAAIVIAQTNYLGMIEDIKEIGDIAHKNGALLIVITYPISLGILEPPGNLGADIVVGEGQCLGLEPAFGGNTLGIFAAKKEYVRYIPGRIVGKTTDANNNDGYVLTLQAREQHIRRAKALSNICSNQAWCALNAAIYLSLMGANGLKQTALKCMQNAYYLADGLDKINGLSVKFKKGFFNEFVLSLDNTKNFEMAQKLLEQENIVLGLPLKIKGFELSWLVSVTETKSKSVLDLVIEKVGEIIKHVK